MNKIKIILLEWATEHPCRVIGAIGITLISMAVMVGVSLETTTITGAIMCIFAGIGFSLLGIVFAMTVDF